MSNLVLISGKKRSGKDYTAAMLAKSLMSHGYSVEIRSFAKPIKHIISTMLGISEEQFEEYKNDPDRHKICLVDMKDGDHGFVTDCRAMLQQFGNQAMKPVFGNDVWAKLMADYVSTCKSDYILVPDFRFFIEHIKPSVTVRVECNLTDQSDKHASEVELDDYQFDYILNNDDYGLTPEHMSDFAITLERKFSEQSKI